MSLVLVMRDLLWYLLYAESKGFQNAQVNKCEEQVICYTIYSEKNAASVSIWTHF